MNAHARIDQRSLAFGCAIAARVAENPQLIQHARENLTRWLGACSPRARSTLQEWMSILDGPTEGIAAVLTGTDERAVRLRQSNPFAGVLAAQERNAILRRFQLHDPAST